MFWSYIPSDDLGAKKRGEVALTFPPEKVDQELIRLAIMKALENPVQYLFLTAIEGAKMLFWESSRSGMATYPAWLERILWNFTFDAGLIIVSSLLTLISLTLLGVTIFRKRALIFSSTENHESPETLLFFIFFLILTFVGLYSFFFILDRYSYPIASLYIVLIAWMMNKIVPIFKKIKT